MDTFAARLHYTAALLRDDHYLHQIAQQVAAIDAHSTPAVMLIAGAAKVQAAQRLAILAGSFNPPTNAHIALANAAKATGRYDAIVWSISRHTVDKEQVDHAPLVQRLAILAALTQHRSDEAVALINRGLYVDQATTIRANYPQVTELTFIIGFDKITQLLDDRYYTNRTAALIDLFAQARVLVAPRGNDAIAALQHLIRQSENRRWAAYITFLPLTHDVRSLSSSAVRQQPDMTCNIPPESVALIHSGAYQGVDTNETEDIG